MTDKNTSSKQKKPWTQKATEAHTFFTWAKKSKAAAVKDFNKALKHGMLTAIGCTLTVAAGITSGFGVGTVSLLLGVTGMSMTLGAGGFMCGHLVLAGAQYGISRILKSKAQSKQKEVENLIHRTKTHTLTQQQSRDTHQSDKAFTHQHTLPQPTRADLSGRMYMKRHQTKTPHSAYGHYHGRV